MPATSSLRPSVSEWIQTALLAANLVWTTLCLGGYLPQTLVVTGTLSTLLLIVHLLERAAIEARGPRLPASELEASNGARFHPAGWLLAPFLAYAAANVLWITPVPWLGWQDWFGWAQAAVVFWVVLNGIRSPGPRQALFATLLALGLGSVVLACYQRFVQPDWLMPGRVQAAQFIGRTSGPFGIPNSLGAFLLLLIPVCGAVAFRRDAGAAQRVFFAWLAVVLSLGLVLTISRGAWIALGLALTIWPCFSRRWRLRRRIAVAIAVCAVVGGVGATIYSQSPKVRARFDLMLRDAGERSRPVMWRAAWRIFLADPAWGSGAGSYNVRFENVRPEHQQAEPKWAHNDYLNTLSDYGVVGFALCFGAVGAIAWRTARTGSDARRPRALPDNASLPGGGLRPRPLRRLIEEPRVQTGLAVGLLAFALQLFVEFHLKIPALAMAAAAIGALVVGTRWPVPAGSDVRPSSRNHRIARGAACAVAASCVAIGAAWWNTPRMRAEAIRYGVRSKLDALAKTGAGPAEKIALAERARDALGRAVQLDPKNAQAWADRAYATAILGHEQTDLAIALGREAEADARRALAISTALPESWIRLGVSLDMQDRWGEAGPAFSEALRLAPSSATAWFYQAYHLALNPVTVPLARSAVATCLRLDGSLREADALRRHLMDSR